MSNRDPKTGRFKRDDAPILFEDVPQHWIDDDEPERRALYVVIAIILGLIVLYQVL
ncbi:hypothetical protein [Paramagnetospirillum kuznetsovii]|uniref:hypothetical protein n=1 Tax=Paramagnetospirillum kuznetsovii TaxID=2053833 RepID=UPI001374E284|nr:hypothetical protein [Paramagnetospirillum kuznetsovii]